MDSVFLLGHDARSRLLHTAARAIVGCVHIYVWSYIPYPSNCLICTDGWLHEDGPRRLFDMYRTSFCSVESGCVPGFAYKEGMPYIELVDSDLMNLASTQVQKQFYQEAGIKRAVFMGCKNGEIEIGMSNMSDISVQMIHQLFNEDLIQQYQIPGDQSHPSSSSSSLRSLSVSSPEYSSLLLPSSTQPAPPMPIHAYPRQQNIQFPSPAGDDTAIMRAMLTVISSTSSSSSSPYVYPSPPQQDRPLRAFAPYNQALAPNIESRSRLGGHKMIKSSIAILRRVNLMKAEARLQESRLPPTTNQLHHMISERKRREKLNESFHALRMLLPPGTKKDKASVLFNTREYLKSLKTQVSELEERNRMLELQLLQDYEAKEADDSNNGTVEVQVARAPESTSQVQRIALRVTVRVECDMNELLLRVLECLKEMGGVSLVSVNANTFPAQMGVYVRLNLSLQFEVSDWDEGAFKEAVTGAVNGVLAARLETANR